MDPRHLTAPGRPTPTWRRRVVVGLLVLCATVVLLATPTRAAAATPPSLRSRLRPAPTVGGIPPVSGPISAPGGPYLFDDQGRVVFFHGVNAVYKHPPYELFPDPGKPWNFSAADASLMARLGFNVVRLGMTWQGLEPGTAPANDPDICTPGTPGNPEQFNKKILDRYLDRLRQTVDLLGRYHIYTILDMHQDVYNQMFRGEGAPNWAVCTQGVPFVPIPGRWSKEYEATAVENAYTAFWTNDVVGDLQGEYDQIWADVASFFKNSRWILGYDPFNEPFSTALGHLGKREFATDLECFYAGSVNVPVLPNGLPTMTCPANDPAEGVIAQIQAADPHHLIFYEPDLYGPAGSAGLGPMDFADLVFNVHVYCRERNPVTGNPTDLAACAASEDRALARRREERTELASAAQPTGPAWFVTEFGATSSTPLLDAVTSYENDDLVGWTYWSWQYYGDPTGSSDEALVTDRGVLRPTVSALAATYPEAVAGIPRSIVFHPTTGAFRLVYRPRAKVRAPTVIFVPTQIHYPHGYCAQATGGTVISPADSTLLEVRNGGGGHPPNEVTVTVRAGACPPSASERSPKLPIVSSQRLHQPARPGPSRPRRRRP